MIDIVAPDLPSLLVQARGAQVKVGGQPVKLELAGATMRRRADDAGQQLLDALANPNIMYLLMMAGVLGLYFEFAHPGVYLPGVAGAICLLLALGLVRSAADQSCRRCCWCCLGVVMLLAEVFVTSYGVIGIGGVIALVIGSLFLIDTSQTNLEVSRGIIAGARDRAQRDHPGPRLRRSCASGSGQRIPAREGMIGEVGEVREAIAPGVPGRVFVHGEIWRAVSDQPIGAGARARVTAVRGLEIEVRGERDAACANLRNAAGDGARET